MPKLSSLKLQLLFSLMALWLTELTWPVSTWGLSHDYSQWHLRLDLSENSSRHSDISAGKSGRAKGSSKGQVSVCLSVWSLYVTDLGFLPAWPSQGGQTTYIVSGFLRVSISRDPGRSYKAPYEVASEFTQAPSLQVKRSKS